MSESQASTYRERQCQQTDEQDNQCPELQLLRPDAEQPFTRVRRGNKSPYLTPIKRLGWICRKGHFDEPTPEEVLCEACRLLLECDRETSEILGSFEFRKRVPRSLQIPQDAPALPAPEL
jgi:hypothetical protein